MSIDNSRMLAYSLCNLKKMCLWRHWITYGKFKINMEINAMTTVRDIEKDGGKCEKVGTDFWECTDKDGKVWWCSDGGNL